MSKLNHYVSAWWRLSRIPFLSVGLLPLLLGFALAWRMGHAGPLGLHLLATAAVVLIMWMTYYIGEWNDVEGDRLNRHFNRFSGGSRVLADGILSAKVSILFACGCLAGALFIGVLIYFKYQADFRIFFLGGIGIFSGFFYSSRPFRWVSRGVGEILIGFCYGWLPIATGFFLLSGFFSHQVVLLSLPVGFSIFNVILINEFPDEEADRMIGKKTLVVRFGKEKMSDLYLGISILTGLSFIKVLLSVGEIAIWILILAGIPIFLILWNLSRFWQEASGSAKELESLCRNTLLINLSITMILALQETSIPFVARS